MLPDKTVEENIRISQCERKKTDKKDMEEVLEKQSFVLRTLKKWQRQQIES